MIRVELPGGGLNTVTYDGDGRRPGCQHGSRPDV